MKKRKLGTDPKLPKLEAYVRRMQGGGDEFDKFVIRLRERDGPFLHTVKPKVIDREEDEEEPEEQEEATEDAR